MNLKTANMALVLAVVLSGCHDHTSGDSGGDNGSSIESGLYEISLAPDVDTYYEYEYKAIGLYGDGTSSMLEGPLEWHMDVEGVVSIDSEGKVTPISKGTTQVTVSYQGITSNVSTLSITDSMLCGHTIGQSMESAYNDSDDTNASGNCLKIAVGPEDKLFTSSPSVSLLTTLGYVKGTGSSGVDKTYADTFVETGAKGPAGEFARFDQLANSDEKGGQLERWCNTLSEIKFAGKSEWRRAKENELLAVVDGLTTDESLRTSYHNLWGVTEGSLWSNRGWPTHYNYWIEPETGRYTVDLFAGQTYEGSGDLSGANYGVCVYEPEFDGVIKDAGLQWLPPLTKATAEELGVKYDYTYTETGDNGPNGLEIAQSNWNTTKEYCENLDYAEYSDWRMPTKDELVSFATNTRSGVFKEYNWASAKWVWSSSFSGDQPWGVKLTTGAEALGQLSHSNYSVCVRDI